MGSRKTFIESKSSCTLSSVCRHGSSIFPSFSNLGVHKTFSNSCYYSKDVTVNSANIKSKIGKDEIDYNEFEHYRLKSKAIIIDVRSPEELRKNGMIPNTINIPISHIAEYFHGEETSRFEDEFGLSFPTAEDPIIVFCKMGVRSEMQEKFWYRGQCLHQVESTKMSLVIPEVLMNGAPSPQDQNNEKFQCTSN